MKRNMVLVLLLACLLAGCIQNGEIVPWSPKAKLLGAHDTFNGVVNALATLRKAGAFTKTEAEQIGLWITTGQTLLDQWGAALELGQPVPATTIQQLNDILRDLVAARTAGERAVAQ